MSEPMRSREPMRGAQCGDFGGRRKDGQPCGQSAVAGTKRCRMHAGKSLARAKAEGAVVVELAKWGLGDTTVDPGEVLLRLVTQSAARCELYARLLGEAYDAAERLKAAHEAQHLLLGEPADAGGDELPEHPATQAARRDLERIFGTGGVAALIGHRYDADKHGRVYPVDEGIRGLARLEAEERDRCASFAAKAVAAGLAERQVRLAEQQGALVASVYRRAMERVGLPAEARTALEAALVAEIQALTGPAAIEGRVVSP